MNSAIFDYRIFSSLWTKTPKQVISQLWQERTKINESDVNLFCWKRNVDSSISRFLEKVLKKEPEPIQFYTSLNELEDHIGQAKQKWTWSDFRSVDLFWEDVTMLARDFISFSENKSGTVHLRAIANNACTKFHTDGYTLRLFTTYYGKGTEWLPEKAINRLALGTTNDKIVRDPSKVDQMEAFEVGILKGELPNRPNRIKGIVHRSPEIKQTGKKRIILRIDI